MYEVKVYVEGGDDHRMTLLLAEITEIIEDLNMRAIAPAFKEVESGDDEIPPIPENQN